jgi:hypothetical protein
MISKRFLITILTFLLIVVAATAGIFFSKGYRLSSKEGTIAGTGILSITSSPDQASVYLDGHLTTATNTNINSLPPKTYDVKVVKEGYIPWEKQVEVKEGLVSDVKATLFRAIPTVYPLSYTGAINPLLSPDGQKLVYIVPGQDKKSGIWVWQMSDKSIALARGAEPHQIALSAGYDYTRAKLRWSPDSAQVLVEFPDQKLLLDSTRLNDPPRDITAIYDPTTKTWDDDQQAKDLTRLQLIVDPVLRKTASSSAFLKFSPDESKILYSVSGKDDFKVVELVPNSPTKKPGQVYNIPAGGKNYEWLPDSDHLYFVEGTGGGITAPTPLLKEASPSASQIFSKVSVLEYDGSNKSEIYAGNLDPDSVYVWPDGSRLVIISSLPTATASTPNLFGINLK